MTAVDSVKTVARRAKHNRVLEVLTRVGFVGFGVVHLLVAWIAVQLATGVAPAEGDQDGAFRLLVGQEFGRLMVTVVAIGLVAMMIWQALEAAVGHVSMRGFERTAERLASVGRVLFYGYLGYAAYQVLQHSASTGAGAKQEKASSLLAEPGGRTLVGAIGLGVLVLGLGLVIYGLVKRFERHLNTHEMSAAGRRAVRWLGVIGYVAKGVGYAIAGALVFSAAVNYDPAKSRGLDAALHTLAGQPRGDLLLSIVAAGIAAYGVFCFAQARYRKV